MVYFTEKQLDALFLLLAVGNVEIHAEPLDDLPTGIANRRHDANAFVYVLEGSIVEQVRGGKEVTPRIPPASREKACAFKRWRL